MSFASWSYRMSGNCAMKHVLIARASVSKQFHAVHNTTMKHNQHNGKSAKLCNCIAISSLKISFTYGFWRCVSMWAVWQSLLRSDCISVYGWYWTGVADDENNSTWHRVGGPKVLAVLVRVALG